MGQSYFIWNDFDCRSMGVKLGGPVSIVRPEERVKHVQVPGRSGDLTYTEGENIFNSYIQTATILVHSGARVRDIYKWLRGSGYVTFSGEPDRKQAARIIGAITLDKQSHNLDWWTGEVQFYCNPLKELLNESKVTITSSSTTVVNTGDVTCYPLWKVTVSSGQSSISLTANNRMISVTGLTAGSVYLIDSDTMEIWNSGKTALLTNYSSGAFPTLAPGSNTVTFTNCSSIEIERRERFL